MKDGNLKISIEAGEITGVSVNAGLDWTYQRLFETARRKLRKPNPTIETRVQVIVFGCFWCEAVYNEAIRELLLASTKPAAVAESVWENIQRVPFESKFSIVTSFANASDPERARRVLAGLKVVFELRNRLAHFKDKYVSVSGPLTLDELKSEFFNFPDADLIAKLRPPSTEDCAEAIVSGINWLNEIYEEYFQVRRKPLKRRSRKPINR